MFEDIKIRSRPSITRLLPTSTASTVASALVRRDGGTPSVRKYDSAIMGTRTITTRPSVVNRVFSPSTAMLPMLRGGGAPTTRTDMGLMGTPANIPLPSRVSAAMGDTIRALPAGRSVVSPVTGDRTGILPPSTLATQGVFGGENGGMGAAVAPTALGPATLTGLGSNLSKMGTGVMNTITSLIPLAIKVILAVIVIKIVLWLLRGRRR